MKKLFAGLLLLLLLTGCSSTSRDDADYTGQYGLIPKGECASLVIHWEYPDDAFDADFDTVRLDLSKLEKYIDPNADLTNGGVNLNNLLGTLGFHGRSFIKAEGIGMDDDGVAQVVKKNLPIYLYMESTDGRSVKVRLEYDKSIHD